jgi:hypothetical protein
MSNIFFSKANYSSSNLPVFSCAKSCTPTDEVLCKKSVDDFIIYCLDGTYPNYNYNQCPLGTRYCQVKLLSLVSTLFILKYINIISKFLKTKIDLKNPKEPSLGCAISSLVDHDSVLLCNTNYCNIPIKCYVGTYSNLTHEFCSSSLTYCQVNIYIFRNFKAVT